MDYNQLYNDDVYEQMFNWSTYPDLYTERNYSSLNTSSYLDNTMIERIVIPMVLGLVIVVGFVGNLLVMATIGLNPDMRTIPNVLAFNLSVASLCLLVLCLPFSVTTMAIHSWPFGAAWCKLHAYFKDVSNYVTAYTLVTMATVEFDRSVTSFLPLCLQRIGMKAVTYTVFCVIAAWVLFLASLSPLIAYMRTEMVFFTNTNTYHSLCFTDMTEEERLKEVICHFVLGYCVPLCMSFVLCVCAMIKSPPSLPQTQVQSPANASAHSSHRRETVTWLIMIVVVIVLWGPKWIEPSLRVVANVGIDYTDISVLAIVAADNLSYIPSSVFPIILLARSKELQQGLRKMFHCASV